MDLPGATRTTGEPGKAEAESLSTLATMFELVAIDSIEEVYRGYFLDASNHSNLHGPVAQAERKRRWDAIKSYFQHPGFQRYRHHGNDTIWFEALDWLLYVALGLLDHAKLGAAPATITRDEASELVDACMAAGVLKASEIPNHCGNLRLFLESRRTSYREDV